MFRHERLGADDVEGGDAHELLRVVYAIRLQILPTKIGGKGAQVYGSEEGGTERDERDGG